MAVSVIEKRITSLESRNASGARVMHFIRATNQADADRQVEQLCASGTIGPRDGFLCLTGRW